MSKTNISTSFFKELDKRGFKGKIVDANHIPDLHNDIRKHYEAKTIYAPLYEEYKAYFEFESDVSFESIESIFLMAVPVPQFKTTFLWKDKDIVLLIPPTYLYGTKIINELKEMLETLLKPQGYNIGYAQIPLKTLSVRSNLAEYGRNNITYVEGIGSFYRLVAYYSDYPTEQDSWQELRMMDLCKECSACVRNCPTGAIPTDRFLLRAGRCLTYHNEQPKDIPFPNWIDPSWHNCLVGCLHCQKVCPANKRVKDWVEPGPIFNENETRLMLNGEKFEDLPIYTQITINQYDLTSYYDLMPRNLSPFFKK